MNTFTSKTEASAMAAFEAAENGNRTELLALADASFNLEDCDPEGNSVLHYAVKGENLELVRFLVEIGGLDPCWANQKLVTPYDLAHGQSRKKGRICDIERYFEKSCGFSYEQCYRNPVCRGMHPDPSIVRVGEDYYMVNSSFVFFPGIPVSHSRDLVHWKVIGYVAADPEWAREHLGSLEGGRGFWAPDISYYQGRFYVCATLRLNDDVPDVRLQMVTSAERPEGPYETPVLHAVDGIDPSIFTDDDGRRYMLLNRGARIMELSGDGKHCLSKPEMIWYGSSKHAPEGPHLLKKDGWYYCFLAEGGTGKGHMVTVARSKNLRGPYEDCPYNPILRQTDEAGALQCCGHGKPVSTPGGRWFMVYLCSRFLDGKWGMLGRETALDELVWTPDGWPVIRGGRRPSAMAALPFPHAGQEETMPDALADTSRASLWMAPRTIDAAHIQIEPDGSVTIRGDGTDLLDRRCKSLLLKWQPDFDFDFAFTMQLAEHGKTGLMPTDCEAGVVLYYDENTFIKFGIGDNQVFVKEYIGDRYVRQITAPFGAGTEKCSPASGIRNPVYFRVVTEGLTRSFYLDGSLIGTLDNVTCLCSEGFTRGKRFTGAAYGVYVYGNDTIRWRQHSRI